MTEDIVEAVASIVSRVMARDNHALAIATAREIITAYEAARGDVVAGAVADGLFHGSGAMLVKPDGSVEHIDRRAIQGER